jgi:hypothetical protein
VVKEGDTVTTSAGSFSISQTPGFTIATRISDGHKGSLSDKQVTNIVFNETRSLSGDSVQTARVDVAQTVINGEERLGSKRPVTASSHAHVPKSERGAYSASQSAVALARAERSIGFDPTNGSVHFNLRSNDSISPFPISPFQGHALETQAGPLNNSFPTPDLPATGIYVDTYQ